MAWSVAPSLVAMRYELDRLFPNRSTASDGTIGDVDHQARKSDHNPGARNLVHARDVTHDPANGVDCGQLVGAVVFRRDPRISYIIWDGRIWRSYHRPATDNRPFLEAWHPELYTGTNQHKVHAHFSIHSTVEAETNCGPWWEKAPAPSTATIDLLEFIMPVFKNDGDAEVFFVRECYLKYLGRQPESEFAVLTWVGHLREHGADFVASRIADSQEGQDYRAAQRKHLGV